MSPLQRIDVAEALFTKSHVPRAIEVVVEEVGVHPSR
jgi:hypothetical protein